MMMASICRLGILCWIALNPFTISFVTNAEQVSPTIEALWDREMPSRVVSVAVSHEEIEIRVDVKDSPGDLELVGIPMELRWDAKPDLTHSIKIGSLGASTLRVPRMIDIEGKTIDRLFYRWMVIARNGDGVGALSHARYADTIALKRPSPSEKIPISKKGLGGWYHPSHAKIENDLEELKIASVTVNVFPLHQFVDLQASPQGKPFQWQGRTYYLREDRMVRYDDIFRKAMQQDVMVSAILLIANPKTSNSPEAQLLGHPDAEASAHFAMPNVQSSEGLAYYGAILDRMADRWSRPDGSFGRIHHWIAHNEVDYGWEWTNAGAKSDTEYLDLYQRSLRLIHLVVRQYDDHGRPFVSLTHHWTAKGHARGYGSKRMLDLLSKCEKAEGLFPWGLAYHPYPQSLFGPRTWEDKQAQYSFDTPKITPKNLEVLEAYLGQPEFRYRDTIRPIHLSENGFHSRDYSDQALEEQAAGMAYAWSKVQRLPSIQAWHYHNWVDNRHEGGLRIGLRRFPDDPDEPFGKKPIWHLYQAFHSGHEESAMAPYLKTIGIPNWEAAFRSAPIAP